ncbi:MAG: ATP-binding protein [Paludibacteraceae bacterium]|nr:ATP-binding protein [Paludibacteraceae bacterium]
MNFEVGQTYEMKVRGIDRDTNGNDYISVVSDDKGDEKKDYRVYNFTKGYYDELPQTIYVYVKYIDAFGKVRLYQNQARTLQEHYDRGKMYPFHITGIEDDSKGHSYYRIEDDFAEQRYYFSGEPKHGIGDDLVLEVSGIVESNGYLLFKEVKPANRVAPTPADNVQRIDGDGKYYANYGPESKTVEYKTSIVFPPNGDGEADIDKQILNIVKALTAMMNAEGGKLIIGVHDRTQEILGVEKDYPYLDSGDIDKYAGSYSDKNHEDSYKRKILNAVRAQSGTYAGSLLKIDRKEKGGKDYYVIEVTKADKPIWMRGNKLYQRQDGSSEPLWGEELTQFIFTRMQSSVQALSGGQMPTGETIDKLLRELINKRHSSDVVLPPAPTREVDYWVVWDDKGAWYRQRDKAASCYLQLPVYKNMSNPVLLLCYKNAKRVAAMNWTDVRKGTRMNALQPSLWNTDAQEIPEMFIAESRDYLAIHSIDHNGTECMKLLAIGDFNTVQTRGASGVSILPDNAKVISFKVIDVQYYPSVKDLLVTKTRRARELGTPINTASKQLAEQINYLRSIP